MNIAIDYDGTYGEDVEMWKEIIHLMKDSGHKVYCITKRYRHLASDIKKNLPSGVPIIFVKTKYKTDTTNKMRLKVDVWIDDKPSTISQIRKI